MTEGPPDGIALPHADQIVDHETIADTLQQAAAQPAGARPRLAELAEDQVRRIDAGLAEDAAAAVPGARGSCSGPGRRFQVIEERAQHAALDERQAARGHSLVVAGA